MSHLTALGAWVAQLRYDDIPAEILRAARLQILNMVAAAHAATRGGETRSVTDGLQATTTAPGSATVLATGQRLAPVDAAMANSAASMAQDFDDILWMGHTCHSAVFAPLAVAEHERSSTRDLLTAVVAANEIAGRLGASSFFGPLNGQMWSFIHLVGAAAGTAKLLGLDGPTTTHALAIALAQPTFPLQPGFFRPTSKLLTAATPTAIGMRAAYYARAGMTGEPTLLEDARGFWRRFSFLPLPSMLGGLGEFWALGTLAIKTFPGCFYFQTSLSAVAALLARRGKFSVDQVAHLRIATSKLGTEVTRFAGDYVSAELEPVNVNFDLALSAAVLLTAGQLTSFECDQRWLAEHTAEVRAWRDKIVVEHDPKLTVRVMASANAVGAGKSALDGIGPVDLARMVMLYRREYRSSLLSPKELLGFVRAARATDARSGLSAQPPAHAVPLYFPGRARITFTDGTTEEIELDLPTGSMCAHDMEGELRQKFLRESAPTLGPRTADAFAAGLALEQSTVTDFVRLCSA